MVNTALSKLLSYVLRHRPDKFGLELGEGGWVSLDALLAALSQNGKHATRDAIVNVVRQSDKQRFALSEDGLHIRANQGHSVSVELGLTPVTPPPVLYHGTTQRALPSIMQKGLVKGRRHHVHLSADPATAALVGGRRGPPLVLTIDAQAMSQAGLIFYRSANGVWLTDWVPPAHIQAPLTDGD